MDRIKHASLLDLDLKKDLCYPNDKCFRVEIDNTNCSRTKFVESIYNELQGTLQLLMYVKFIQTHLYDLSLLTLNTLTPPVRNI